MRHKYEDKKNEIIELYNSGKSLEYIAKLYKTYRPVITRLLKHHGITIRSQAITSRKYNLDLQSFTIIDSEIKAYVLGFLFADAYNSEKQIVVSIHEKDVEILYVIQAAFGTNSPIHYRTVNKTPLAQLFISSPTICKDLSKLGCIKAKSHTIELPNFLNKEMLQHFIRGYFDGDGYISKDGLRMSIVSNPSFCQSIQEVLIKECNLKRTKLYTPKGKKVAYLKYSGKHNIQNIYNYLYRDANYFLKRKRDRFILPHPSHYKPTTRTSLIGLSNLLYQDS